MGEGEPEAKVLYVDDEPSNLTVFQAQFRKLAEVRVAPSGAAGLELLANEEIPLVISDQRMPGMSGWEFLATVRRRWPDTVRMVMTAHTNFDDVVQAINEGEVARYLSKPWDATALHSAIVNGNRFYHQTRRQRLLREELLHRERLTAIGGLTSHLVGELSQLESVFGSADPRENLDEIEAGVRRFAVLIDTLRLYSKGSVGSGSGTKPVDLNRVVERCRTLLALFAEVRGLRSLEVRPAGAPVIAEVDPVLIEQAVISLVRNAAAADRGAASWIRLSVSGGPSESTIDIQASGPPLPEEDLAGLGRKVLSDHSDRRIGLGFQLVQRAVMTQEGSIRATNSPDGGVAFRITLPVPKPSDAGAST